MPASKNLHRAQKRTIDVLPCRTIQFAIDTVRGWIDPSAARRPRAKVGSEKRAEIEFPAIPITAGSERNPTRTTVSFQSEQDYSGLSAKGETRAWRPVVDTIDPVADFQRAMADRRFPSSRRSTNPRRTVTR